jgi:phage gpG-like protein
MADLKDLERDLLQQERAIKNNYAMNSVIGNEIANNIIENIENQSYDRGDANIPFKERSEIANRTYDKHPFYKGTPYSSKNRVLIQSKSLLRSITFKTHRDSVNVGVFQSTNVIDGSDVGNYAKKNNEGLNSRWKVIKKTISLPKRQFMPTPSEDLNPKMKDIIKHIWERTEQKIFSKFTKL